MALAGRPRRVLILGGGDGLALREVLRWEGVTAVTLVDLDPAMTGLSDAFPPLAELNGNAFADPRVTVVNRDAFLWAEEPGEPFDAAIIDFPDPSTYSVGKLYTTRFYRMLGEAPGPGRGGRHPVHVAAVRPASYWCIVRTLEAAGFAVRPYHAAVPSFGVWGFALARREPFDVPTAAAAGAAVPDRRDAAGAVRPAAGPGAGAGGGQPAR